MSLISRLFGKGEGSAEVICPRCERPLDPGHACKGLSRRFFLGAIAGAAVASPVIENGGLGGVLDRIVSANCATSVDVFNAYWAADFNKYVPAVTGFPIEMYRYEATR